MADTPIQTTLQDRLAEANLRKVEVEIEDLLRRRRWFQQAQPLMPLLMTTIAVLGFVVSVWQFAGALSKDREQREREQAQRQVEAQRADENQIRANLDELLTIAQSPSQGIAKVPFIFSDLNRLVARRPSEVQAVTDILVMFARHDADFSNPRHRRLETEAIAGWKPYAQYLQNEQTFNNYILYLYERQLTVLHDEDPQYFESIRYDPVARRYRVKTVSPVESRFLRLVDLVRVYHDHLRIATKEHREQAIARFAAALRNQNLADDLVKAGLFPS